MANPVQCPSSTQRPTSYLQRFRPCRYGVTAVAATQAVSLQPLAGSVGGGTRRCPDRHNSPVFVSSWPGSLGPPAKTISWKVCLHLLHLLHKQPCRAGAGRKSWRHPGSLGTDLEAPSDTSSLLPTLLDAGISTPVRQGWDQPRGYPRGLLHESILTRLQKPPSTKGRGGGWLKAKRRATQGARGELCPEKWVDKASLAPAGPRPAPAPPAGQEGPG